MGFLVYFISVSLFIIVFGSVLVWREDRIQRKSAAEKEKQWAAWSAGGV